MSSHNLVCYNYICIYIYIYELLMGSWASLVAKKVKNPSAMWETWVQSLGWEDPLEEWICSILAWRMTVDRGAWQAAVHGVTKS